MRAETWEQLNGMCFGDDPFEGPVGDPYGEDDLLVPECVQYQPKPQFYAYHVPVSAYCGQAVGRVKHRRHQEERERRSVVNGAFWVTMIFVAIALAVNLPEWIW